MPAQWKGFNVQLPNSMIKDQGIGIANPWTTVRGSCGIDELFNCLTGGLAGVRSSRFGVRGSGFGVQGSGLLSN